MQSHGVASSYPIRTSIPNHSVLCYTLHTHTHISMGLSLKQLFLTDRLNTTEREVKKRANKEDGSRGEKN